MSRFHILAVIDNDTSGDDCDGGSKCLLQSVNESLHPVLGNAGMLEATLQVASGGDSMTRTRFTLIVEDWTDSLESGCRRDPMRHHIGSGQRRAVGAEDLEAPRRAPSAGLSNFASYIAA